MTVVEGGKADAAAEQPVERECLTLSVTVITPFGGGSHAASQRHIINYHRVKHLIEQTLRIERLNCHGDDCDIRYKVGICLARSGNISREALTKLAKSNIVIAMLSDHNVNVIYELGIRNMHRPETLLLLNRQLPQDGSEPIPVYLKESAFNLFSDPHDDVVAAVSACESKLDWKTETLEPALARTIERCDVELKHTLERSLQELVDNPPRWLQSMNEIARDRHPDGFLHGWSTYLPTSVVRIDWKRRSDDLSYRGEDMDHPPMVADANYLFRRIFHIENLDMGPDVASDITFERLMLRIQPFVAEHDYADFLAEQAQLMKWIVLGNGHAVAEVPLRFKADGLDDEDRLHPNKDIRGKIYLPCLTAKTTVGDTDHPHSTYLIISFVEQFWPTDHPQHPKNRDN